LGTLAEVAQEPLELPAIEEEALSDAKMISRQGFLFERKLQAVRR
jgi:hypothetical protein